MPRNPVAAEIARLAGTLPAGWPRLEKLRAIAANFSAQLLARLAARRRTRHPGDRVRSGAAGAAARRARRAAVRAGQRSGRGVLCRRCAALCDRRARRRHHAGDARRRTPEGRRDRRRPGDRRKRDRAAHADAARQRDHDRAGRDLPEAVRDGAPVEPDAEPPRRAPRVRAAARARGRRGRTAAESASRGLREAAPAKLRRRRARAAPKLRRRSRPRRAAAARRSRSTREPAAPERRQPLRFVWNMDADERFTLAARAFADAVGPRTARLIGKPWREIAARARARSGRPRRQRGRVARHLQRRHHRVADRGNRRDHDGGIVRPADLRSRSQFPRLSRLRRLPRRRACAGAARRGAGRPDGAGAAARSGTAPEPRPQLTVVPAAKNVVPFRGVAPGEAPDADPDRALGLPRARRDPRQGRAPPAPETRRNRAEAGAARAKSPPDAHCRARSRIAAKRPAPASTRRRSARRARTAAGGRPDPSRRRRCSTPTAPSSNGPAMRTSRRSRTPAGSSGSWSSRAPARSTAPTAPARPSRSRPAPATR